MICTNCKVSISEEDHRCQNCGRRLGNDFGPVLAIRTATALKLDSLEVPQAQTAPVARPRLEYSNDSAPRSMPRHASALQGSLFSVREEGKVHTIGGYGPATTQPKRQRKQPVRNTSFLPQQGVLEFPTTAPAPRTLATSVDAVIYCDYPVATRTHRLLAGLIDFVIVLGCMMLFLGILYVGCEGMPWFSLDTTTMAIVVAATGLLGLFYEVFWLLAETPSPGMECVGLRLVHFDGNELTPKDHRRRIFGGVLSMVAGFIGLAWAFVDEECLTWQDHISRTFPTPVRAQYGRRR
jgi:uncharacterized RDD family membrane protein YckC